MKDNNYESTLHEKSSEEGIAKIDLTVLFGDFIKGFIRFWWLVVVAALLFGTLFYGKAVLSYKPIYCSEATFTVSVDDNKNSHSFYYNSATAEQLGLTFPHILSSELLMDAMKNDMGVDFINGTVEMKTVTNSNMVTMYAKSPNPKDAKRILESAIKVYPGVAKYVVGPVTFNMIDNPTLPTEPGNQGDYNDSFVKGAIIGLGLGILIIALYAFFRKTIHSTEEIDNTINIPSMVSLPILKRKKRTKNQVYFPTIDERGISPVFAETIESLRIRVENELNKENKKVLMVTSTVPGEGKSLVATNLAYVLGKHDKKVLLVDGDFRKQDLTSRLGLKEYTDFENFDLSAVGKRDDIFIYDKKHKIYFLGGNEPVEDTSYFLPNKLTKIVEKARDYFDYIIIDTPPAGDFEDSLVTNSCTDAILYVVKQDYAPKTKVLETMTMLHLDNVTENEESKIIGYVFNGVTGILGEYDYNKYAKYGYGYGAKYGYGKKYGAYGSAYGAKPKEDKK